MFSTQILDPADGSLLFSQLIFYYLTYFQKNLNKEVGCEKQRSIKIADFGITVRCSFRPPSVSAIWKTDLEGRGGQENSCMFLRNPELELAVFPFVGMSRSLSLQICVTGESNLSCMPGRSGQTHFSVTSRRTLHSVWCLRFQRRSF